jgi:hypothetical protein
MLDEVECAGEHVAVLGDDQTGGRTGTHQHLADSLQAAQRFDPDHRGRHGRHGRLDRDLFLQTDVVLSCTASAASRNRISAPRTENGNRLMFMGGSVPHGLDR